MTDNRPVRYNDRQNCYVAPEREELILGHTVDWNDFPGDLIPFGEGYYPEGGPIDAGTLGALIAEGYVDADGRHNDSPTVSDFLEVGMEFIYEGWDVGYCGHLVGPARPDARVGIDSVLLTRPDDADETAADVAAAFNRRAIRDANEVAVVDSETIRLWWD